MSTVVKDDGPGPWREYWGRVLPLRLPYGLT